MIADLAPAAGLFVSGIAPLLPADGLPPHLRSVLLLSPDEPRFWAIVRASPEWQDGAPDPLDRWSRRVIDGIAAQTGGTALYPFGGPPFLPFIGWAERSGRCHPSPVHLLVHDLAGLFISFRGAIAVRDTLAADPRPRPCDTCADQPCLTACPAGALTPAGYDVPSCHGFLDSLPAGDSGNCRQGCLVRRACPVGQERRRPEQSAHHMRHFHK